MDKNISDEIKSDKKQYLEYCESSTVEQKHLEKMIIYIEKLRLLRYGEGDREDIKLRPYHPYYMMHNVEDLETFLQIYRFLTPYLDKSYRKLLNL
jgi:hypothetical protein